MTIREAVRFQYEHFFVCDFGLVLTYRRQVWIFAFLKELFGSSLPGANAAVSSNRHLESQSVETAVDPRLSLITQAVIEETRCGMTAVQT